jgi:hypothetical protein
VASGSGFDRLAEGFFALFPLSLVVLVSVLAFATADFCLDLNPPPMVSVSSPKSSYKHKSKEGES